MISDFNLLATTDKISESAACSELWVHLREIGDSDPVVDRTGIWGVIHAKTNLSPLDAITRLRKKLVDNPDRFRFIYRILPIESVVKTDLVEIADLVEETAKIISDGESFRITVEKRRTRLHSIEVIEAVAPGIDRPVDLEEPEWIVLIEIVGHITGVSVIQPDGILNIQNERYQLSHSDQ